MARYVDVDKYLSDDFCDEHDNCTKWEDCFLCWSRKAIEDVAPVVHAKWESKLADNGWKDVSCSNCKHTINVDVHCSVDYKYCPYCGARMIKGKE